MSHLTIGIDQTEFESSGFSEAEVKTSAKASTATATGLSDETIVGVTYDASLSYQLYLNGLFIDNSLFNTTYQEVILTTFTSAYSGMY